MNLHALSPTLASKLGGFSRRYNLGITTLTTPDTIDTLIVLSNGTPDDLVVFLIAYHLNGEMICAIVKPDVTGISTFDLLRSYLTANPRLTKVIFIIDEEVSTTDLISKELESKVKKSNIGSGNCVSDHEGKTRIYDCTIGSRDFKLSLVVNGLSTIPTKKHTIEDHLLQAAEALELVVLPKQIPDPKSFWQYSLGEEINQAVFLRLKERRRLMESTFPQQMKGFTCLKE